MGTVIENFLVGIGMKPDAGSFSSVRSQFAGVVKAAAGVAVAIKGAQAVFMGAVLGMAKSLDALSDSAGRIGTTVTELDKLGYIASQTDSSLEAVQRSLEGLNIAAGSAELGMKRQSKIFDELGIKWKDQNGKMKDSTTLLYEVGDAMKGLSKADQLALGTKLGIDRTLIGTITGDMSRLTKEYETFARVSGQSLEETAQASSDLMDEVGKSKTFYTMLMRSIMGEFIVKLRDGFKSLRVWALENADKIKKVIQAILAIVGRAGDALWAIFRRMGILMQKAIDWWSGLDDSSKTAVVAIAGLTAAIYLLNAAMHANPAGLIAAAIAGLFLLVDDFLGYKEGMDSFFDWGPYVKTIDSVTAAVRKGWDWIVKGVEKAIAVWNDFKAYLEGGESLFDWSPLVDTINAGIDVLKLFWEALKASWGWISENVDFDAIFGVIGQIMRDALAVIRDVFNVIKALFTGDIDEIMEAFKNLLGSAMKFAEDAIDAVIGVVKTLFGWITDAIGAIGNLLGLKKKAEDPVKLHDGEGNSYTADDLVDKRGKFTEKGKQMLSNSSTKAGLVSPAAAAGAPAGTSNNNQQTNNIDVKTDIHLDGVNDPQANARAIENRMGDVARNTAPLIVPTPAAGGAK